MDTSGATRQAAMDGHVAKVADGATNSATPNGHNRSGPFAWESHKVSPIGSWYSSKRSASAVEDARRKSNCRLPGMAVCFNGEWKSNYDIREVTPGALEVWLDLPEEIRDDPSLAPFREQYEKQYGAVPTSTNQDSDDDPKKVENGGKNPVILLTSAEEDAYNSSKPHLEVSHHLASHSPRLEENLPQDDTEVEEHHKRRPWLVYLKIGILLAVWAAFTVILMMKNEKEILVRHIAVPTGDTKSLVLGVSNTSEVLVSFFGPFISDPNENTTTRTMEVWLERIKLSTNYTSDFTAAPMERDILDKIKISETLFLNTVTESLLDTATRQKVSNYFKIAQATDSSSLNSSHIIRAVFKTDLYEALAFEIVTNLQPINLEQGVIFAAIILAGLYILIIFEIVHRTFAAILASSVSIAVLALLDERPTTAEIVSWIDVETLLLLFSMMILVAVLAETGVFDYLAVYAYKLTGGKIWPLLTCLCFFTAVLSSFLDNVTTVLLMTPVTIRLCEVMELNPIPILMAMVVYSNVGGTATPVGDPPNVIIASNQQVIDAGVNFSNFTLHVGVGILLVSVQTYFQIRFMYRKMDSLRHSEPQEIRELRREVQVWKRAAASLSSYSKDEDLVKNALAKKVKALNRELKNKQNGSNAKDSQFSENLNVMLSKYPIRDRVLLIKASVAVMFVIIVFFLHSIPELKRLSLGWTALLGAIMLLIMADLEDLEPVIARVEWTTLLFFAALFVLMEALSKLGLIMWIGKQTENLILSVGEGSQLAVAILLLLWVSAIVSAFVDNIPLTTMMVRVVISLGNNPTLNLPIQPLIWALAFGACLGGNGTLIGASANVVCAGVAEQHGYRFTFMEYFRIGCPLMIGSIIVSSFYLIFCHVVFAWH